MQPYTLLGIGIGQWGGMKEVLLLVLFSLSEHDDTDDTPRLTERKYLEVDETLYKVSWSTGGGFLKLFPSLTFSYPVTIADVQIKIPLRLLRCSSSTHRLGISR